VSPTLIVKTQEIKFRHKSNIYILSMHERLFAIGSRELKVLFVSKQTYASDGIFIQEQSFIRAITHFTMENS